MHALLRYNGKKGCRSSRQHITSMYKQKLLCTTEIRPYIIICNYVIDETGKCIGEMALFDLNFSSSY
jgi:hypothetical protein